ncbi:hypothetical protein JCM8097_004505 [Rhodosporidiobolus ruineniae]
MASTASSTSPTSDELKAILTRPGERNLSAYELSTILAALTGTGDAPTLALAIFSRYLAPSPSSSTRTALQSALEARLSGTDSNDLVQGLAALSAVLQTAPPVAASLLQVAGLRSHLEDAVELISKPVRSAKDKGKEKQEDERLALVELLSLAAGQPSMRGLVRATAAAWLESLLGEPQKVPEVEKEEQEGQVKRARLKALAAVAVVKLRLGKDEPSTTGLPTPPEPDEAPSKWSFEELTRLFVQLVVDAPRSGSPGVPDEGVLLPALEGLAYLTLTSSTSVKEIATESPFLTALFSFAPKTPTPPTASSSARDFAIATLLDHLTAFTPPPDADKDAEQIARLKRFASAAAKKGQPAPSLDRESPESVTARVTKLVKHDPSPIPTIRQLCLSSSIQTRRLAAKILHSLVTPQPLRGLLLQAGAARFFLTLIRQLPSPFSPIDDTPAVQGLAKLLITANPLLVLGPTASSPLLLEATTALTLPLGAAPSASEPVGLLPRFESLMALTNIASLDPALTETLASLKLRDRPIPLLQALTEELLLSTNTMVRRAAAELVCNLAASDAGLAYFEPPPSSVGASSDKPPSQQLHLLLALSSAPDLPTRLASSGALTSLVYSPSISLALASHDKWVELLLGLLVDDDPGVRHRAYEVWRVVGEMVGQASGQGKERAAEAMKKAEVGKRLKEAEEREEVGELRGVVKAAREAVEQIK